MTITTMDKLLRPGVAKLAKATAKLTKDKESWRTEDEIRSHYGAWRK